MPNRPVDFTKSAEALIVGLASAGDSDAFAELVARRQSWIRNLMRRCSGDATLADDLAQQVFLLAWRKIGYLREPTSFGAWLKRLAISTWLQHVRKNDSLHAADDIDDTALSENASHGLGMDLDRALATLSHPVRLCIVLSYHEGMTNNEIAALADLPLGTVKSHIRRGTQRLQQILSAYKETAETPQ